MNMSEINALVALSEFASARSHFDETFSALDNADASSSVCCSQLNSVDTAIDLLHFAVVDARGLLQEIEEAFDVLLPPAAPSDAELSHLVGWADVLVDELVCEGGRMCRTLERLALRRDSLLDAVGNEVQRGVFESVDDDDDDVDTALETVLDAGGEVAAAMTVAISAAVHVLDAIEFCYPDWTLDD